jgi:hypothetical protein
LIEAMYRIRWKVRNLPLISKQTRGLLQYLRTVRNANAHAIVEAENPEGEPCETAVILARSASRLWAQAVSSRSRFVSATVTKDW